MEQHKQQLLDTLRTHVSYIQGKVAEELRTARIVGGRSTREIAKMRVDEQAVAMQLKGFAMQRTGELEHLEKAPYFVKCEVGGENTEERTTYYFAKHQLSEENIYSWVSPIAAIRFEQPGEVSYRLPNGEQRDLTLRARDQYMIVDGKVLFFAREEGNLPRELIYQEHFTQKKSGFMLPEIVAQMEKAQDQVIRAHYAGPLVISGPAGSGKTTLALHRVAYLTQAPDTAAHFPPEKIIVFVQDTGTRDYFSHLLPELGIHNVTITTFSLWVFQVLGIEGYEYISRYGANEEERDVYEYQKIRVLRNAKGLPEYSSDPLKVLSNAYTGMQLFEQQQKEKKLDRFDLTLLLMSYLQRYKKIETKRYYNGVVKGVLKRRVQKTLINYSLMVIDEFQNYLPEQFKIFDACMHEETKSIIYVGDTAQQVYLGTLKDWKDIDKVIEPERKIKLDKVYRNTKYILEFIQSLGYSIQIPAAIKKGTPVLEKIYETIDEEIKHITSQIEKYREGSIGILAKNEHYLQEFKEAFKGHKNIQILTMNESQGVEFDLVCLVGIHRKMFEVTQHEDVLLEHLLERARMQKDLLYVALTRAISELHILGTAHLKDCVQ